MSLVLNANYSKLAPAYNILFGWCADIQLIQDATPRRLWDVSVQKEAKDIAQLASETVAVTYGIFQIATVALRFFCNIPPHPPSPWGGGLVPCGAHRCASLGVHLDAPVQANKLEPSTLATTHACKIVLQKNMFSGSGPRSRFPKNAFSRPRPASRFPQCASVTQKPSMQS